jgi:hypothetical protein
LRLRGAVRVAEQIVVHAAIGVLHSLEPVQSPGDQRNKVGLGRIGFGKIQAVSRDVGAEVAQGFQQKPAGSGRVRHINVRVTGIEPAAVDVARGVGAEIEMAMVRVVIVRSIRAVGVNGRARAAFRIRLEDRHAGA